MDSDELLEVVVTFLKDKQYSSQIYDVSCSHGGCNATLQQLDYSLLTNMTAVPFLLDPDGSGHINIFTFTPNGRIILKYDLTAGSPKLYLWSHTDNLPHSPPWCSTPHRTTTQLDYILQAI